MNASILQTELERLKETGDCKYTIDTLEVIGIDFAVDYFKSLSKPSQEQITELGRFLSIFQFIYNNGDIESPISDDTYDQLYSIYKNISKSDIVGSVNPYDRKTTMHRYPVLRGSLDKVHFVTDIDRAKDKRESVERWMRSIDNRLDNPIFIDGVDIYLFPKWDGVSLIFECSADGDLEDALTRGDVTKNEAMSLYKLFKSYHSRDDIDTNEKHGVKTEVVMSQENYERACVEIQEFSSRRSAVSSIINNKEFGKDDLSYLTIKGLQYKTINSDDVHIHPDLFKDPYMTMKLSYNTLDALRTNINRLNETIQDTNLPTDGVVIRIKDKKIIDKLGRNDAINNYEVAYKFPAEYKKTILRDIEFQYGLLGSVTPVAKIEPVKIKGNKISSISLGSIERFKNLELQLGDEVIIKYEIIPYLEKDSTCKENANGEEIKIPDTCPYCSEPLTLDPILGCYNMSCEINVVGNIVHYLKKMGIANISLATVKTLCERKYLKNITDIYRLSDWKEMIIEMKGFGRKSYDRMITSINARKNVFDYELLGSLGINSIGRKIFKRISSIYYIHELKQICEDNKVGKLIMEGIGEDTANKIIKGVNQYSETIDFLCSVLQVRAFKDTNKENSVTVCFTKCRDKEFEKFLVSRGVEVSDYNKKVDMVICKDPQDDSGKIKKARKDNKTIISLEDAYKAFQFK